MAIGWWKFVGGNWLVAIGWWKFVGGNWLVAVCWWQLAGGSLLVALGWWQLVGGNWLVAIGWFVGGNWLRQLVGWQARSGRRRHQALRLPRKSQQHSGTHEHQGDARAYIRPPWRAPSAAPATQITAAQRRRPTSTRACHANHSGTAVVTTGWWQLVGGSLWRHGVVSVAPVEWRIAARRTESARRTGRAERSRRTPPAHCWASTRATSWQKVSAAAVATPWFGERRRVLSGHIGVN